MHTCWCKARLEREVEERRCRELSLSGCGAGSTGGTCPLHWRTPKSWRIKEREAGTFSRRAAPYAQSLGWTKLLPTALRVIDDTGGGVVVVVVWRQPCACRTLRRKPHSLAEISFLSPRFLFPPPFFLSLPVCARPMGLLPLTRQCALFLHILTRTFFSLPFLPTIACQPRWIRFLYPSATS